jgi:glutamate/aspartate transport system substrate-binding protein
MSPRFLNPNSAVIGFIAGSLLVSAALAQPQSLERIAQRKSLTIGYRDDAAPFSSKDASGNAVGYAVEICQSIAAKVAQQAGIPGTAIRYLAVPLDQMERYVKGSNVDLFCSATSDTVARRKVMNFSAPIFIASTKVLTRKKDNVKSFAVLGGKSVVVIDKTTAMGAVVSFASQKGLAISEVAAVGSDAALGQLRLGWVAGYARDDVLLSMQLAAAADAKDYALLPDALSNESIAIAYQKDDAALGTTVRQALVELHKSGGLAVIYNKWFTKAIAPMGQSLNLPMSSALKASLDAL